MLWEFYPDHPNLLPAYWDESSLVEALVASPEVAKQNWVSKPRFGREGTAITYWKSPQTYATRQGLGAHKDIEHDLAAEKDSLRMWATGAERNVTDKEMSSYSSEDNSPVFPLGLPVFQQW